MAEVLSKSKLFSSSSSSSSSSSTHLFSISGSSNNNSSSSSSSLKFQPVINKSSLKSDFHGHKIVLQQFPKVPRRGNLQAMPVQMSLCIGKAQRWWEKGLQQNMKEITSAQDLVDSLLNSGNKLVIVDFFSPGCGGCKALHPKICQFAEMNPDVQFLQVNHEEHKSLCYSLNVHVLPFFRFYRGAHGRLCSFSCTNATIKKFRDALGKHSTERCSLGPPRGLEETELLALAANKDLSFNYTPKKFEEEVYQQIPESTPEENTKLPVPSISKATIVKEESEDKTLIAVGR